MERFPDSIQKIILCLNLILLLSVGIKCSNQINDGTGKFQKSLNRLRRPILIAEDFQPYMATNRVSDNFTSEVDLTVSTRRCICSNYVCRQVFNIRSRMQKNCEDLCCQNSKQLRPMASDLNMNIECGVDNLSDIKNLHQLPWIVQIMSKSHKQICIGSLIHPKLVLTTLVCAMMQIRNDAQVRIKESVGRFENEYQIRNVSRKIMPENYSEIFANFGFNTALLVLEHEFKISHKGTKTACLLQEPLKTLDIQQCFVYSIENINRRYTESRESVLLRPSSECMHRFKYQNRQFGFQSKANVCAESNSSEGYEITSSGAPLICFYRTANRINYAQVGMLAWPTSFNGSPHLFTNIYYVKNWIDKYLKYLR